MKQTRHRIGAAMSEFVLILPLLVVIIALLFYFGRLMVRADHATVVARYEAWREAQGAPGPHALDPTAIPENPELNGLAFGGKADHFSAGGGAFFPQEPYDKMVDAATNKSPAAVAATQTLLFRAGNEHRYPRGQSVSVGINYDNTARAWDRINAIDNRPPVNPERTGALSRSHTRIGMDWSYSNDPRSCDPFWTGGGGDYNHPRGVRDAFFSDFDSQLDAVDGEADHDYNDSAEPESPADSLSGLLRRLYLDMPGYVGPVVFR
jgi:hypothetical protein